VRFVRHNAERFNVRADRIGAVGGSSGGHLVESLGVLDGEGIKDGPTFPGATNPPDYMGEMVRWLDRYLKQ
jgi:acetyl esterase/lipase